MRNYNFGDMAKHSIFTAQHYGTKISVEIDHSDLDLDEVMESFKTLVVGMGYSLDTWKQWIMETAEQYQEEENEKWDDVSAAMEHDEERYENLRHNTDDSDFRFDGELITQAEYNRRRDKMAEDMKNLSDWDNTIGDGLEDDEELPEWMQPNENLKNAVEEFRKEVKNKKK